MNQANIKIKRLDPRARLPKQARQFDAGFDVSGLTYKLLGQDLSGFVEEGDEVTIPPLGRLKIDLGFAVEIPVGFEIQVRPRSGLALKQGLTVLNSPGTIDAAYRGEVGVILVNLSGVPQKINITDRVAQLVVAAVPVVELEEVDELSDTERGTGGFGSTGTK